MKLLKGETKIAFIPEFSLKQWGLPLWVNFGYGKFDRNLAGDEDGIYYFVPVPCKGWYFDVEIGILCWSFYFNLDRWY